MRKITNSCKVGPTYFFSKSGVTWLKICSTKLDDFETQSNPVKAAKKNLRLTDVQKKAKKTGKKCQNLGKNQQF